MSEREIKVKIVIGDEPEAGEAVRIECGDEPDVSESGVRVELVAIPDDISADWCSPW